MPLWKHEWVFTSSPSGRWSEVYYSDEPDIATAVDYSAGLLIARRKLLHPINRFQKIVVSNIEGLRESLPVPVNAPGTWGGIQSTPANLAEAAVCSLVSTVIAARRKLWLRGLPEEAIARAQTTGVASQDVIWTGLLQNFIGELASPDNRFVILVRKRNKLEPGADQTKRYVITGITSAADGTTKLTFNGVNEIPNGSNVVIGAVDKRRFPGLRGTYPVIKSDIDGVHVEYEGILVGALQAVTKGYAYRLEYRPGAFISPAFSGWQYLGSRQTKNELTGSVGARSAGPGRRSG